MVGAAAALLLSNENVRGKLMGLVSGAGDMLKSGGSSVKEGAVNTASAVKENMSTGSEIFKETYAAGKQGFQESVERHKAEPAIKEVAEKHLAKKTKVKTVNQLSKNMSNSANKLSSANRAMLVGAIAGGSATIASQWKEHKAGNIDTNEMATSAAKSALKTAAIAGATTYVAEKW